MYLLNLNVFILLVIFTPGFVEHWWLTPVISGGREQEDHSLKPA
jgi:hypothetical protein